MADAVVDPAIRIQQLKSRIKTTNDARIGAEKTLELLKATKETKVAELNALGIDNVEDLPSKILELQGNMEAQLVYVEQNMTDVESKLSTLNG